MSWFQRKQPLRTGPGAQASFTWGDDPRHHTGDRAMEQGGSQPERRCVSSLEKAKMRELEV